MKTDIKYGFFVGIGLIAAFVIWHLVGRAGGGLVEGAVLA
jgi:hypothetical protein